MKTTQMIFNVIVVLILAFVFIVMSKYIDNANRDMENFKQDVIVILKSQQDKPKDTNKDIIVQTPIRIYSIEIDEEKDIISKFIRHQNYKMPQSMADIISDNITSVSQKEDIPIELIIGIIQVESSFDPFAVSPKNARGLMQVLDRECNGQQILKSKLHNIDYNILMGVKILKSKLSKTQSINIDDIKLGDINKALFYYVGKDDTYADKVSKIICEFIYFRSQLLSCKEGVENVSSNTTNKGTS